MENIRGSETVRRRISFFVCCHCFQEDRAYVLYRKIGNNSKDEDYNSPTLRSL